MDRHSPLFYALLTPEQMGKADQITIESGTDGFTLMEKAGRAVFDRVIASFPAADHVHVFCGPGNNGGDGYVVAELLRQAGRDVVVSALGDPDKLTGDAALARKTWRKEITPFHPSMLEETDLIIDALFGAGLTRAIEGDAKAIVTAINDSDVAVVSIDLPSGVNGASGKPLGQSVIAEETVTFFRKKPGHLLAPGRDLCGHVNVADIGIEDDVLKDLKITTFENAPGIWSDDWPGYTPTGHKYARGHALILSGGPLSTGAARLSATAALRVGAGVTSLAGSRDALMVHAAHVTAIMLKEVATPQALKDLLEDPRLNALAAGPGLGLTDEARAMIEVLLESGAALTLDADALTLFKDDPDYLFRTLKARDKLTILTPHEGEFKRLFGPLLETDNKLEITRAAAVKSGSVIVLKGADTVIASPDGRAAVNGNAPPWLATAGSGDVLTGIITGLCAQGMPAFEAACAAVWLHGESGNRLGPYLVADDLESGLSEVLDEDSNDWTDDD